jgi:hypothetical protein
MISRELWTLERENQKRTRSPFPTEPIQTPSIMSTSTLVAIIPSMGPEDEERVQDEEYRKILKAQRGRFSIVITRLI